MFVNIKVFAGLKDFFGPELHLNGEEHVSVQEVILELCRMQPNAKDLLGKCRFAVSEEFVSTTYKLKNGEELYLIPPSSGG